MRSRYSAYVLGLEDYLFRTWHPRTRPDSVALGSNPQWQGLQIVMSSHDVVEFRAFFAGGVLHETSRFELRAGHWVYVDGDLH